MIPFLISVLRTKKPIALTTGSFILFIAEAEGFEPPVPCGTLVFKTSAFDHSATPPYNNAAKIHARIQIQSKYTLNIILFNSPLLNDNRYYVKHTFDLNNSTKYCVDSHINSPIVN